MLRSILTQVFFYPSGMYFITLRNVLYKPSRGVAIFSISMVLVSTLTFVLSTLEVLQVSHSHPPRQPHPLSPPLIHMYIYCICELCCCVSGSSYLAKGKKPQKALDPLPTLLVLTGNRDEVSWYIVHICVNLCTNIL